MKMTSITWSDLARVKKTAKAAKDTLPLLTHAQRLNYIAATEYGVRHFHELKKQYEAQVASHIDADGGVHYCHFCSFTFAGTLATDIKEHNERHQLFEEAQAMLGFIPMPYKEREQIKRIGYEWMRSSDPGTQRQGALTVLLSHFERSMECAVANGRWHKHPYFTEYLSCALPSAGFIPKSTRQLLTKEFGEQPGIIPADQTNWPSQTAFRPNRSASDAAASKQFRESVLHTAKTAAEASIPG